jgi:outer membrane lipase/esterase
MTGIRRFVPIVALLSLIAISTPGAAGAAGFDQFVGLGDSTIDTGYFRYNQSGYGPIDNNLPAAIAQGATGGFAGNGVMGPTILAGKFGLSAGPVGDGNGGTNYANGAGYTNIPGPFPGSVSATQQIQNYLTSVHGAANPDALYIVSSGNNDLLHYQQQPANFLNDSAAGRRAHHLGAEFFSVCRLCGSGRQHGR